MKDLKLNDPVMWQQMEYRFVKYSHEPNMGWITQLGVKGCEDTTIRHAPIAELDLIVEFDFIADLRTELEE